jgi:hypothetical protein
VTGVDLFTNPDHIAKALAEFDRRLGGFAYAPRLGVRKPPLDYRRKLAQPVATAPGGSRRAQWMGGRHARRPLWTRAARLVPAAKPPPKDRPGTR